MISPSFAVLAGLLAVASASPCRPRTSTAVVSPTSTAPASVTPTLPSTGSGSELVAPAAPLSLLKIAVGHGLQNYTCVNGTTASKATGALAVLYDVTDLYPGTPDTGLTSDVFDVLPNTVLRNQDIPLNLQNAAAASPGTTDVPNAMPQADYGAVAADPFPTQSDLTLPNILSAPVPFLGHHYFDGASTPTFDLSAAGLLGIVAKQGDVKAPADADKGILGTGAVDWLSLNDTGSSLSKSVKVVYRVTTAGGVSQTCDLINTTAGSVPYAAFYWFYG